MMTVESDADIRRREAAAWFARLKQRRVAAADVQAFSEWRKSRENAEAFARIDAMWNAAEVLGHDRDMADLTAAAAERGARSQRRAPERFWKPAAVGVAVAVLVGVFGVWFTSRPEIYSTAVGERRVVQLADGSTVTLDTNSRIAARLNRRERHLELVSGQALFDVHRDANRPFIVSAGETRVTALGTRFDVRHVNGDIRVILLQGSVRVDAEKVEEQRSWTLRPGQQVIPSAVQPVVASVDAGRATSWTTGRLIFDETPLSAAIDEVNRYSKTRIELRSAIIADVAVSGAFDAGDTDGFVSALTHLYAVRAEPSSDGVIVLRDAQRK